MIPNKVRLDCSESRATVEPLVAALVPTLEGRSIITISDDIVGGELRTRILLVFQLFNLKMNE